jgi:hypothetical protein
VNLFQLRAWPFGPNLISCGVYGCRGFLRVFVWLGSRSRSLNFPLPVRSVTANPPYAFVTGRDR